MQLRLLAAWQTDDWTRDIVDNGHAYRTEIMPNAELIANLNVNAFLHDHA